MKLSEPTIHACAIVLGRYGVLIEGASGSGKSRLADGLIEAYHKRGGFARWVADDRVIIRSTENSCIAEPELTLAGRKEHAYLGIINTGHLPQARMDLAVQLVSDEELERMPQTLIDDRGLPQICVPQRSMSVSVPLILARLSQIQ